MSIPVVHSGNQVHSEQERTVSDPGRHAVFCHPIGAASFNQVRPEVGGRLTTRFQSCSFIYMRSRRGEVAIMIALVKHFLMKLKKESRLL